MITTFFLTLAGQLYALGVGLLPTGSLPPAVTTSLMTVVSWLNVADVVVDIDSLLYLLTLFFVIEAGIQAVQFFFWVYSKLPIIGK